MTRLFMRAAARAVGVVALLVLAGCGGSPEGLAPDERSFDFVDGPVDHLVGNTIPPFRVWILDRFGRRATPIQSGTIGIQLLGPGGEVQDPDLGTVAVDFGQGTFAPSVTLPAADGYRVRARFEATSGDSPRFSVVTAPDVVRITSPSAGEMGVLVDGANNILPLQDSVLRTTMPRIDVGVLNSGVLVHEVGIFSPDRRAELVPIAWTADSDTLTVALRDPVEIPVTVWVVGGSFANAKANAEGALAQLTQTWSRERVGVAIGDIEVMDATSLEPDFGFFAIGMGAPFGPIGAGVGRATGRFNIYIVSQIRSGGQLVGGFGEQPGTAIAVTDSALAAVGPRTLGHELGHNFGLQHTDNLEGFATEPNMMQNGGTSMVLTEGQVFRVHFNQFSPLGLFRTGDTFERRTCAPVEGNPDCPELGLRIWPESQPAAGSIGTAGGSAAANLVDREDGESSFIFACGVTDP